MLTLLILVCVFVLFLVIDLDEPVSFQVGSQLGYNNNHSNLDTIVISSSYSSSVVITTLIMPFKNHLVLEKSFELISVNLVRVTVGDYTWVPFISHLFLKRKSFLMYENAVILL